MRVFKIHPTLGVISAPIINFDGAPTIKRDRARDYQQWVEYVMGWPCWIEYKVEELPWNRSTRAR